MSTNIKSNNSLYYGKNKFINDMHIMIRDYKITTNVVQLRKIITFLLNKLSKYENEYYIHSRKNSSLTPRKVKNQPIKNINDYNNKEDNNYINNTQNTNKIQSSYDDKLSKRSSTLTPREKGGLNKSKDKINIDKCKCNNKSDKANIISISIDNKGNKCNCNTNNKIKTCDQNKKVTHLKQSYSESIFEIISPNEQIAQLRNEIKTISDDSDSNCDNDEKIKQTKRLLNENIINIQFNHNEDDNHKIIKCQNVSTPTKKINNTLKSKSPFKKKEIVNNGKIILHKQNNNTKKENFFNINVVSNNKQVTTPSKKQK